MNDGCIIKTKAEFFDEIPHHHGDYYLAAVNLLTSLFMDDPRCVSEKGRYGKSLNCTQCKVSILGEPCVCLLSITKGETYCEIDLILWHDRNLIFSLFRKTKPASEQVKSIFNEIVKKKIDLFPDVTSIRWVSIEEWIASDEEVGRRGVSP